MDDKNTNKNQSVDTPIAKVSPSKPNNEFDYFSQVYKQQKNEQQAVLSSEEKTPVQEVPVITKAPVKKNDKFNILFIFLIIIIVVLFAGSSLYLFLGGKKDNQQDNTPDNGNVLTENTVSASLRSPFTYQNIYNVTFPDGIQEQYKALYAQNTDFAGWLTVPGTCIDTPVYKQNNNSYYLKHDNYGNYTKYGIPFLDEYNNIQNLSKNTVIYGHNFDNELIFDELHNYRDLEFYKQNPVIEFNTLYKDYKWKVIAAFHTNGDSDGDNGYLFYYVAANMGNNSFMKFYDELQQRSYIHTGVDVQPTDKVLTLSTCTYFFDTNGATRNARFAVIARLVRDGESEEVDTSLAQKNENVRYPQLYYTAYGGTNPFRNASHWVPESN